MPVGLNDGKQPTPAVFPNKVGRFPIFSAAALMALFPVQMCKKIWLCLKNRAGAPKKPQ
jgi:hypothetical protein